MTADNSLPTCNPEDLSLESFFEILAEKEQALRLVGVVIPQDAEERVRSILGEAGQSFESSLFRHAAAHLLNGLDAEMATLPGGSEMLEERLWSLPENLQVVVDLVR